MARATIDYLSYQNLGTRTIPALAHVSLTADNLGDAVTFTADYTVGLGSDGDPLIGKLEYLNATLGHATVAVGDTLLFDGVSGALPSEKNHLVVNGAGAVRVATSADAGYQYASKNIVVGVDSTTRTVAVLF